LDAKQQECDSLKADIQTEQGKVVDIKKDLNKLQQDFELKKQELIDKQKDYDLLKGDIQKLKQEYDTAIRALKVKEETFKKLDDKLQESIKATQRAEEKSAMLQFEIDKLKEEGLEQQKRLEQSRKDLVAGQSKLQGQDKVVEELKGKLKESE